jgi:DNA modification methylase
VREPYACHKHRRTCRPVERADHFLRRYADDTVQRLAEFDALRTPAGVAVLHADARTADLPDRIDGIVTSPPYPGLIDYHEQHRYAYELLRLDDRRELELGAAAAGTSRRAIDAYCEGIAEALARARPQLSPGANAAIVVNDRRDLYDGIARRAGYTIARRDVRHVNRRTGRRAGEYFEQILWLRPRPAGPAA